MTYRKDFTLPAELMELVSKQGLVFLPELIQVVINAAMRVERQTPADRTPPRAAPNLEQVYGREYEPG